MDEGDESKPVVAEASDEDIGLLVEGGGAVLRTAMGIVVGSTSRPPRRCSRGQYDQGAGIMLSEALRLTWMKSSLNTAGGSGESSCLDDRLAASLPFMANSDVSERNLFNPPAEGLDELPPCPVPGEIAPPVEDDPTGTIGSSMIVLAGLLRICNNAPSPHPTSSTLLTFSLRRTSKHQAIRCSASLGEKTTPTCSVPFSIMLISLVCVNEVDSWTAEGDVREGSYAGSSSSPASAGVSAWVVSVASSGVSVEVLGDLDVIDVIFWTSESRDGRNDIFGRGVVG